MGGGFFKKTLIYIHRIQEDSQGLFLGFCYHLRFELGWAKGGGEGEEGRGKKIG